VVYFAHNFNVKENEHTIVWPNDRAFDDVEDEKHALQAIHIAGQNYDT